MQAPSRKQAFTLIELLIVVAIIAILAAIAVPNFLEARTRSKIARAKSDERSVATGIEAYVVDYNSTFPDGNDPVPENNPALTFTEETGIPQDSKGYWDGDSDAFRMRCYRNWRHLTTPVAYMTSIPIDSFSRVLPYAYDTWWDSGRAKPYFALICSLGPDRIAQDGYDGINGRYDATNGTLSGGDVCRLAGVTDMTWVHYYLGTTYDPNP